MRLILQAPGCNYLGNMTRLLSSSLNLKRGGILSPSMSDLLRKHAKSGIICQLRVSTRCRLIPKGQFKDGVNCHVILVTGAAVCKLYCIYIYVSMIYFLCVCE